MPGAAAASYGSQTKTHCLVLNWVLTMKQQEQRCSVVVTTVRETGIKLLISVLYLFHQAIIMAKRGSCYEEWRGDKARQDEKQRNP